MKRAQAEPITITDLASASAALVRTRAVIGTLAALLAVNGALPLLGHSPVGPWSKDGNVTVVQPQQSTSSKDSTPGK